MTALGSMGKAHKLDPMESPLCNTATTRIRDLCSLQSNRTNHEDRTVCLLGHFTFRRSSALDLLLRPQRKWPSGDRGGTVLLGSGRHDHLPPTEIGRTSAPRLPQAEQRKRGSRSDRQMITSVLAQPIEAAFSRYEAGVAQTSIVQRAVPAASRPPLRPFDVIAIFAVRISRVPGCAKEALAGVARDDVPGHHGSCQHGKKDSASANQSETRHAFSPSGPG